MRSQAFSGLSSKTLILPIVILVVFGCGSSRQIETYGEGEQSMEEFANEQGESTNDEDAEVLRLLGITPNEEAARDSVGQAAINEANEDIASQEIDALKSELDKKDREINVLRSQLTQKESQISDLTAQLDTRSQRRMPTGPANGSSDFKTKYDLALKQYHARQYEDAISIFSELLLNDSENSLSDNCQYWIGECYYGLRNYNQAITEFEKVFLFPNSNKVDASQLKLGLCYMRLGDDEQARAEFERLIGNYPNSEYRATAENYLSKL